MADGTAFRDLILERYDFTPDAREVLQRIPVEVENLNEPRGGGYWYPSERRIFLFGTQDEACLHEMSHAWADETGFYVDPHPDDPHKKGRNFAFRADVERAAAESDRRYERASFLAWEYTYGNPSKNFQGMGELDWERFAGLASGVMGDIRMMPPYLRRWYEPLFGGSPTVPGPAGIPGPAPPGWRRGIVPGGRLPAEPLAATQGGLLERIRLWLRSWLG